MRCSGSPCNALRGAISPGAMLDGPSKRSRTDTTSLFAPDVTIDSGIVIAAAPEFRRVVPVWPNGFSAIVVE